MNCIITGGAGFVGSHLAEAFLKDNVFDKVYIIDNLVRTNGLRNIKHLLDGYPGQIEFLHGDASWFEFNRIPNVSHMFHLAATRINRCVQYPKEGHIYLADSGFNVVNYCALNDVFLHFASSASVYASPKYFPILESDPCIPPTLYGSSKLYTEHLMQNFAKMKGLRYAITRFFSVYGPRMDSEGVYTEVIFNWLNNIRKGKNQITVYGNPDEKVLDLVYVTDVVNAIRAVIEGKNDVYNVSTESGTTLTDLIKTIERVTRQNLEVTTLPENRHDVEAKRVGSTEKLRKLGWNAKTSLDAGIEGTYEWITSLEPA